MTPPSSTPQEPPQTSTPNAPPKWQAYLLVALITASVTGAASFILNRSQPQPIVVHPPPTPHAIPTPEPTATAADIVVFVSGAVQQPDVYTLPAQSRVVTALDAAGGFMLDADVNAVNQAELLWDGAQVYVPALAETASEPLAGVSGTTRSGGTLIDILDQVDINSATLEQLMTLPSIGEVKAQAILDGRPYSSIEDLERVDGIGSKTIDKLRDLVVVR